MDKDVSEACAALIMDCCFWRINQKAAKITSPPGSVLPAWMNCFTAAAVQMKPPHAFSSVISLWCFLSSPALVNQTGLKERVAGWNFPLLPSALRTSASCDPSAAAVWHTRSSQLVVIGTFFSFVDILKLFYVHWCLYQGTGISSNWVTAVSYHVVAEKWTQVLWKSCQCS